jgi:hypothetical protein
MVSTRAGVAQVIANRNLGGKRVRLAGWIKCDSLMSMATIKLYATTLEGDQDVAAPRQLSLTTPWTRLELDMDMPPDTYQVWGWLYYTAPQLGRVYFDDASLEVLGPASATGTATAPAKPPPKPAPPKGRRLGR